MEYSKEITEFAEMVATRTIATAESLLAVLNRDTSSLLYGKPVGDLTEQLLKTALAMQNLHFAGCGEGEKLYERLTELYERMLAVLTRVLCSFHQMPLGETW